MNYLLPALVAAFIGVTTFSITQEQVNDLCRAADARLARIEAQRDEQTIRVATLQWQLNTGSPQKPSVEQLIDAGLIDPAFLLRETVADTMKDCTATATP